MPAICGRKSNAVISEVKREVEESSSKSGCVEEFIEVWERTGKGWEE